jgi:hypothetical protein
MFRGSNPGGGENSAPIQTGSGHPDWFRPSRLVPAIQTGSGAHPDSYTVGSGSPFWGKSGWGVALTIHSHLALRLKKE